MTNKNRLWSELDNSLRQREAAGLLRKRSCWRTRSPRLLVDENGRELVHFGSNDYLGLSWDPRLNHSMNPPSVERDSAACLPTQLEEPAGSLAVGAAASPALTGNSESHRRLIATLSKFEKQEDTLLFPSGFAANVGTVSALAGSDDVLFSDRLNHASLIDGCRLSRAKTFIFEHGDVQQLHQLLREKRHLGKRAFIVTDSVFSMDGDTAPIRPMIELCEHWDTTCIVDEAHGTGVYGELGRGLTECLTSDYLIRVGTLSKAVGCQGGFVSGPKTLTQWLANFARPYIYSTSLAPPIARAATVAIELIAQMKTEREQLRQTSVLVRKQLRETGLRVGGIDSPIIAIYSPDVETTLAWSRRLSTRGLWIPAIRPPTVPENSCLLRISLNTHHTPDDLNLLIEACRF